MMFNFDRHSPGGLDVTEAINLFFKGILLFPIFLFAIYTGIAMMKHMIFHGIPVMNAPTEEQQELLRERDHCIGVPNCDNKSEATELPPRPALEQPGSIDESAIELLNKDEPHMSMVTRNQIRRFCELDASDPNGRAHYVCDL